MRRTAKTKTKKRAGKTTGKPAQAAPAKPKRTKTAKASAERKSASTRTGSRDPKEKLAYRMKIAKQICHLYENSKSTLESCCDAVGSDYATLWGWRSEHNEIRDLFEKAAITHRKLWFDGLKEKAFNSFERLLTGYDYTEDAQTVAPGTDKDGNPAMVVREIKRTKKHIAPNMGAVAMAMRNFHGMKDASDVNHSGSIGVRQVFRIGGQVLEF